MRIILIQQRNQASADPAFLVPRRNTDGNEGGIWQRTSNWLYPDQMDEVQGQVQNHSNNQNGLIDQNEEFTQAASLALFDYLRKSKSKGFVLSLSGGADSSTIATLVAEVVRRGWDELGMDSSSSRCNSMDDHVTTNTSPLTEEFLQ